METEVDNMAGHALSRADQPIMATDTVLGDRKELASFALEHTRMPMVVSDPRQLDNPIVLVNASFLEQTGYAAGEVIGRNCRFLQGDDTDPRAVESIREAVRAARRHTVELLNYRKDGRPFWNQLHISPVHSPGGELVYFFASQMDVTEQRKTMALERAEHALLLEVDHRAKNALALVQGIVRLSGRAAGTDAYADAVTGRVDALAVAHRLLSDAKWQAIGVDALVAALIAALGDRRFDTQGPRLLLSTEQVQPLAIVIHELLVNVRTHGALGEPSGRCVIEWRRSANSIAILVVEHRRHNPAPPRHAGFGTRIIEQVIKRQLSGDLHNEWRTDGLTTTVTVPAQVDDAAPSLV